MKKYLLFLLIILINISLFSMDKKNIVVVQSYHREFHASTPADIGILKYFLEVGYLDNESQIDLYLKNDGVETSKVILKEFWMDSKRKGSENDLIEATKKITSEIDKIKPDLILLGDDNSVKYIGNYYLDSDYPIVFWGVNGLPTKYPVIDSLKKPGHNVTGIYQSNYVNEALMFYRKIFPNIKNVTIVSDDSPTGKAWSKLMERIVLGNEDKFSLFRIIKSNDYNEFQSQIIESENETDLYIIGPHFTIVDDSGKIMTDEFVAWYQKTINKPEITPIGTYVTNGFLCTVDDDLEKQGYEAAKLVYRVLENSENPGEIESTTPTRGKFILNETRAQKLNLLADFKNSGLIELYVK